MLRGFEVGAGVEMEEVEVEVEENVEKGEKRRAWRRGKRTAPAIPLRGERMAMRMRDVFGRCSSVLAKSMAVEVMVA